MMNLKTTIALMPKTTARATRRRARPITAKANNRTPNVSGLRFLRIEVVNIAMCDIATRAAPQAIGRTSVSPFQSPEAARGHLTARSNEARFFEEHLQ